MYKSIETKTDSRAQSFQSFLDKLTDKSTYCYISDESLKKHSKIIRLKPFLIRTNDLQRLGNYFKLPLSNLVINNIIALHILLIDQPRETQEKLIANHKELFIDALQDFYLDSFQYQLSRSYQMDTYTREIPAEYLEIITQFVDQCINLEFNPLDLKEWILEYSTLGIEKSEFSKELVYKLLKEKESTVEVYREMNKAYTVSYGKEGKGNLVSLLEAATSRNLQALIPSSIDPNPHRQLQTTWQNIQVQQFHDFREVSSWNLRRYIRSALNWNLILGILLSLSMYFFGPFYGSCLVFPLALVLYIKLGLDANTCYKYDRTVLPEYASDGRMDRQKMINLIYQKYTPTELHIPRAYQREVDKVETFTVFYYEPNFTVPSPKTRPHRNTIAQAPGGSLAPQIDSKTAVPSGPAPLIWTDSQGHRFLPTVECYRISVNMVKPQYGFITPEVLKILDKENFDGEKRREAFKRNMPSYFKATRAKKGQGIIFFNEQERNQFNAHSKMKLFLAGGKIRIFGHVVAKGPDGEQLIAYDLKKEPKHRKKSM